MPLDLEMGMVQQIAQAVRAGEWPREAAVRLGATRREFAAWWNAGEAAGDAPAGSEHTDHERLCARLVHLVEHAEAEHEHELRVKMEQAMEEGKDTGKFNARWTAYMTNLERRYPDRWRKREMERKGRDGTFDPDAEFRRLSGLDRKDAAADARKQLGG